MYPFQVIVLVSSNCFLICYCKQYKHDNLSLASSQVGIEDGAKLKRKREHVEDNVTKEDEVNKSGSNVDDVAEYVHVEDKETQKLASKE